MADVVIPVVVPAMVEQPTKEDKKASQAQADQMYGKAEFHAPATPSTLTDYEGSYSAGPAAQGPNLTKEESEFAAAAAQNPKADALPEEKTPAPVQASNEPITPAGKEVKDKKEK